jgi:hypothetical protein
MLDAARETLRAMQREENRLLERPRSSVSAAK